MPDRSKQFVEEEEGAITVDWVVITAAVAGLCIALIAALNDETSGLSSLVEDYLSTQEPGSFTEES